MILQFDRPNKLVVVPDTETSVTVQETYDQCRDYEDLPESMAFDNLVYAEGKTDLGGSRFIVVTLFMLNGWRVQFADRTGPSYIECEIEGGNIVGRVGDQNSTAQHPIAPSNYTFPTIVQATTGLILVDTATAQSISDLDTNVETLNVYARAKKVTSQTSSKLLLTDAVTGRTFEAALFKDEAETQPYAGDGVEVQDDIVETTP